MSRACLLLLFALLACRPDFPHVDECGDPALESMSWRSIDGEVVEVTSPRSFVLRSDGRRIAVTIANAGEPFHPDALAAVRRWLDGRRVSVRVRALEGDEVMGEVHVTRPPDIGNRLLRDGLAAFAPAPAYTLPRYSECVNRIAAREAEGEGRGIWRK